MEILREKNSIVLTSNMAALSRDRKPRIGTKSYPIQYEQQRSGDPFHESPDKFPGPKSCFMFAAFTFKIKVSKILKMIRWRYQLTMQNWTVCKPGTVLLFNRFWFQNLPSNPKKKNAWSQVSSPSTELVRRVWLVNTLTSTPSIGCPIRARKLQLIFANNGNEFNRSLQQTLLRKELVTNPTVHDKQKVRPQLHET